MVGMITLVKYDNLSFFKNDVLSFLEQFEAENNLVLGVLLSLSEKDQIPFLMATVIKNNEIGLVLLQTHPSQIILSKSVLFTLDEIHLIGEKLSNTIQEIPGFVGEKNLTIELATYISNKRGINASVAINQPLSLEEADKKAKELINKGNLVGWEINGDLVSMAYATRPTQNNITISYVYTPMEERKKGYASDCVSAFTQSLLDRGYKTTSLYTDLSNPTSNKIYIQIGYEPIMDSILIRFK
jgi:uncharacterized protein